MNIPGVLLTIAVLLLSVLPLRSQDNPSRVIGLVVLVLCVVCLVAFATGWDPIR